MWYRFMGNTKNPVFIPFQKLELEGRWDTSWNNPVGATTYENGFPKGSKIKITTQNGKSDELDFDPAEPVRIFGNIINYSKK